MTAERLPKDKSAAFSYAAHQAYLTELYGPRTEMGRMDLRTPHSAAWYRRQFIARVAVYLGIGVFCAGVWFAVIWGVVAFVRAWS